MESVPTLDAFGEADLCSPSALSAFRRVGRSYKREVRSISSRPGCGKPIRGDSPRIAPCGRAASYAWRAHPARSPARVPGWASSTSASSSVTTSTSSRKVHRAALTGQQFQSPDVEPVYVLFEDFTHAKFYRRSFFDVVADEVGGFEGFNHVDDWVPQRLVTATGHRRASRRRQTDAHRPKRPARFSNSRTSEAYWLSNCASAWPGAWNMVKVKALPPSGVATTRVGKQMRASSLGPASMSITPVSGPARISTWNSPSPFTTL